jgi:hypothetical protein
MKMTAAEWRNVKTLLAQGWVAQTEPIDDSAWEFLLAEYTYDEVKAALTALLGHGTWRPKPSAIVAFIRPATTVIQGSLAARSPELQERYDREDAALDAEREREDVERNAPEKTAENETSQPETEDA